MKVFLSSTYEDLREHRAKSAEAIERLGQQGVRMEVFGARPGEAVSESLDEVAKCELFVGIYAHRYGFIPSNRSTSITEREFDFAQKQGKPSLCFIVDEEFPWPPRFIEGEPGRSRLDAFKQRVRANLVGDSFTTPEDVAYKVASSLGRFLLERRIKQQLETIPASERVTTLHGRDQVSRRAVRVHSLTQGARILLVNDVPSEMQHVVSILERLGVEVETVTTSEEAVARLRGGTFDVIVSDMRRGEKADEGIRFLDSIRGEGIDRPIIFTAGQYRPELGTPAHAFGITNRVDEFLNLLFDALERIRG